MAYVRQPPPSIEVMLDQFDHNGGNMSSARKRAALQKANNEAEFLRQRLMRAEHQVDKVTAMAFATAQKYDQLLLAVGRKFRDESRHETALRYIREAEATAEVGSGCTAAMGSNG